MPCVILVVGDTGLRKSVFEIAYRYVYPAVRRRLVSILYSEHKLTEIEIARLLHVSQSAISRYKNEARGRVVRVEDYPDIDEEVHKVARWIVDEKPGKYSIIRELTRITLRMLARGYICRYHREVDDSVEPGECRVCIELFQNHL